LRPAPVQFGQLQIVPGELAGCRGEIVLPAGGGLAPLLQGRTAIQEFVD
jgi:hypothetical protein